MAYNILLGLLFFAALAVFKPEPDLGRQILSIVPRPVYRVFKASDTRPIFESLGEGEKINLEEYGVYPAPDAFNNIQLESQGVYVVDLQTGELMYEKNSSEVRPLASLAKLVTAILVAERVPERVYIPFSLGAIRQEGDEGFIAGDKLKKEDLIDFMLVSSSNDAAYAAGEFVGAMLEGNEKARLSKFVALMNEYAREVGMSSASFLNPHGLDVIVNFQRIPGAVGSAFDVAVLLNHVYRTHPEVLMSTREAEISAVGVDGKTYTAKNTNLALEKIPQLIGAKTGATKLAGGNLAFIFDAGFERPVLAVLLGASEEGRFTDAQTVSAYSLKYMEGR